MTGGSDTRADMAGSRLDRSFYARDTVAVARDLIGKALVRRLTGGGQLGGIVVEAEAYVPGDAAAHSRFGPGGRAAPMFGPPGHAYVYLIYGVHHCLNAVTEADGTPGAVLIRALEPFPGTGRSSGPGLVCRALGVDRSLNGTDLTVGALWFEDRGVVVPGGEIATGPRVGVDYAGAWAARPYRFWLRGNPHVSGRRRASTADAPD